MGILNPVFGWLLLLTLPIVALYLLRPKSQKKIAPSTYLWKKTIESIDTERLDKRLISNWLFYLQLMAIIIGALLLMQPFFQRIGIESNDIVLVVDSSASMSTQVDDVSRLDEVKETAHNLLDSLQGTPMIRVYSLNDDLNLLYKGRSKHLAKEKIQLIRETHKSLDIKTITRFIDSALTQSEEADVFVLSDHKIIENDSLVYSLSTIGENQISINQAMTRKSEASDYIQVVLENLTDVLVEDEIAIYGEDTLLSVQKVVIERQSKKSIQITSPGHYKNYTIQWMGEDDYLLDNYFYLPVEEKVVKKVLITGKSNKFLEQSLIILPNVEVYKLEEGSVDTGYDLYVYNGETPKELPETGSILLINPDASTDYLTVGKNQKKGQLYFDATDPLWRHVNLNFGIRQVSTLDTVIGKTILSIDDTTVMAKGKLDSHPAVVIGFDLLESDFPIRTGFPVFMHNTATYLLGNLSHEVKVGTVGAPIRLYGDPRASRRELVDLEGNKTTINDGYELLLEGDRAGLYLLQEYDDQVLVRSQWIGLNVSREESLGLTSINEMNENVLSRSSISYQSLKWLFAGILIIVLFIEWWVYYRGY